MNRTAAFSGRLGCWLLVLGLLSFSALAQTATVRGFVTDRDGQALLGVNIIITNDGGGLYGGATDAEGFFIVPRVPAGTYRFEARYIGFESFVDTLTLAAGTVQTVNVELRTGDTELDEVVVETEREAGAALVTAGLQSISAQDIELVPVPDVSADLVNYLTALPSVVASGDRGGQLFIRGGEPTQNLVMLDGMLIYQPFHILGFYSAFPADLVRSTDIYAGGFGAKYGGRLSSVLDVDTRNGNNRRFTGQVTAAPFVSSALLEGPIVPGRISFLASGRVSVIDQGASQIIDRNLPYRFNDTFGKLHFVVNQDNQFSVTALRTFDQGVVGVDEEQADIDDPEQDQVRWENIAVGGRYVLLPASLPMFAEILLSYSQLEQEFGPESKELQEAENSKFRSTNISQFSASADVVYYLANSDVYWGFFLRQSELSNQLGGQFQGVDEETQHVLEVGVYIEPELRLGYGLRVTPGLRVQAFPSLSESFLEPRLRVIWGLGDHQISGAWGIYHQEFVGLNDRRDAGDVFTAWTTSPLTQVPEATHAIIGYQFSNGGFDLSVEGYYKWLSDLFVPEWTAFPRFEINLQPADGTARGFDVRLGYTADRFSGFVTYGFANVEYEARGANLQFWSGTIAPKYNPPHDRQHQVSVVSSVKFYGFNLSARWQFGSGLPFSRAIGFDRWLNARPGFDVTEDAGVPRVNYVQPYDGRLPAYQRLDISLDRSFETDRFGLTLQAGVINATDQRNLFYMDLFTLQRVDQLPLVPSVGIKVEVK